MGLALRVLRIRRGEGRTTALVVSLMFVSMAVVAIGESGINALFFDRIGTHALPLMYLAQAGSTLVAMFALTAVLGRLPHRLVYVSSPLLLAAVVLAERAILVTGVRWIYPVLWVTVAFSTLAQGIGLWGTAGAVVDTRQAKRLFPIFGAGGILGSVVGGLVTRPLAPALGAENLLLVWAGGLFVAFALCRLALGSGGPQVPTPRAPRHDSPLRDIVNGLRFVRRSRLLVWMTASAVLFSVLFYSLFLPFARAASQRYPSADQLAGFFGLVWATITAAAFLISMLLTNRLFAWLGVAAMVLALPLLYAGSFGILMVGSGFAVVVTLRVVTGVWLQGVASSAWETLVNVIPDSRRDQTRAFLNGGPAQVGTAIAGVVALVGQQVMTPRQFAMIGLVASVLTLAAALGIRRSYPDALVEALRTGRPQVFDTRSAWAPIALDLDAEAARVLVGSMRSEAVRVRRLAFQLAAERSGGANATELAGGLYDVDPVVRLVAIRALDVSTASGAEAMQRRIDDEDPSVAASASARALGTADGARASRRLEGLLHDGDVGTRRSAIDQLDLAPPDVASGYAEELARDDAPMVRAAALDRLAASAPDRALALAVEALRDTDPAVRIAAGRALASGGDRAVGPVLAALFDPRTAHAAVEAIRRLQADGRTQEIRAFARDTGARAGRDHDLVGAIPAGDDATRLLRDAIQERGRAAARAALWACSILASRRESMHVAIESLDGSPTQVAYGLETLESVADPGLVRPLLRLWEPPVTTRTEVDWLSRALDDDDPLVHRCAELVRARRGGETMPSPTISLIERVLFLRQVPLFADLAPSDLERVAEVADERGYADGEQIAAQGELGDDLHIIIEGTIQVVQTADGAERELARRTAGEVVGEMSIVTNAPRVASLVADGPVRTIRIGRREFESILRERPDVALGVMRVLAQRVVGGPGRP